ncbi:hypothetical protein KBI52_10145 [Microvirga sp. HBU67558]|uniref:hypothetical protein n=1 Tax=Microvirga TaxID=186650 RepID=UPI001B35A2C0|nr:MULTISPECIES: hypothetical protein [unclassified Microvirga]MBQ0820563.1 hypothetical protein [Microvirga sp. HBU67558]
MTSDMLEAELQRLRDDHTGIADLLAELEAHLARPLPPEPPFEVIAKVTALQDRVYAMARRVGGMKRMIRDKILQQTLAADFSPNDEKIEAFG